MARVQQTVKATGVRQDKQLRPRHGSESRIRPPADNRHLGTRVLLRLQKHASNFPQRNVESYQLAKSGRKTRRSQKMNLSA